MHQIVNFILRNKTFLWFALLFLISILLTVQSHSYHKSKFISSANFLSGGVYSASNSFSDYFHLKTQNQLLQNENNALKSILYNTEEISDSTFIDSIQFKQRYKFTSGQVLRNSFALTNNVLLINKGKNDSLKQDLGVISSKGIIGIVEKTSRNYATVLSILNTSSSISAQLKKSDHFGSLSWNTSSIKNIQLTEIPKNAPVKIGDTIITSGRSAIFPKNIPVGTIESFQLNADDFYNINVKLFNDMANIEHVYIIENKDTKEINNLLNSSDD